MKATATISFDRTKVGWIWWIGIGYGVFIQRKNKVYRAWDDARKAAIKVSKKLNLNITITILPPE